MEVLSHTPNSIAISIYVPASKRWEETEKDKIKLKNILQTLESQLGTNKTILEPIWDLLARTTFWKKQKGGLAIFASKDFFEVIKLEDKVEAKYFVGDSFDTDLLYQHTQSSKNCYILSLSQNSVNLYKVVGNNIEQIELPEVPDSKEAALWVDDPEKTLQQHTTKGVGPGVRGGMAYHGHGANKDVYKTNLTRFLRKVDKAISSHLTDDLPLILACDVSVFHKYLGVTSYSNVYQDYIKGNPENLSNEYLQAAAVRILSH